MCALVSWLNPSQWLYFQDKKNLKLVFKKYVVLFYFGKIPQLKKLTSW